MNHKQLFDSFNNLNILIIGDVMIDSYMWGRVDRISPEAPVPIIAITKREDRLGGAANVALNIRAMGAVPVLCSVIGSDIKSETFTALMKEEGLTTEGIIESSLRQTTVKTRLLGNNTQMLRVDQEIDSELERRDEDLLLDRINTLLDTRKIDAICFQDYDKGVITQRLIDEVVSLANKKSIPTSVDPKKRNFLSYKNVSLFKPNLKELKEGLKIDFDNPIIENLSSASDLLQERLGAKNILITLSEYGVFIANYSDYNNNKQRIIPAHKRQISDVSGAGDTVISLATLCLAVGVEPELMASIANLAGGLVCQEVGVVSVDRDRLFSEVLNKLEE